MAKICTDPSGLPDLRWVVKLSDGVTVYQDDRDGGNSWRELKKHVEDNRLSIVSFHIEFRSHVVPIDRSFAYYFNKGGRATFAGTQDCFIVGCATDKDFPLDKIRVVFLLTPELEVTSEDYRNIQDEAVSRNLIINASRQSD